MVNESADTVVLASGNQGKLTELQDALRNTSFNLVPQSDFGVPEAIEDKPTFVENALIKARNAAIHTGFAAIADDSGLVVPALNGAPGIYSSRYSGNGDQANNQKLLDEMATLTGRQRDAYFLCVLVFLAGPGDPSPVIAEGRWWGRIALEASGDGGFGYDPVFCINGAATTAAHMSREEKRAVSHRGQAVRQLQHALAS